MKAASTPEEDSSLYDPSRLMAAAWQRRGKWQGGWMQGTTPDLARRGQEDNSVEAAVRRVKVAGLVIQCAMAEMLWAQRLGRKTFR